MFTELGRSQVEVQRCSLRSEGLRLRSSGAHSDRTPAVEVQQWKLAKSWQGGGGGETGRGGGRGGEEAEEEEENNLRTTVIKSNNPHLAGGEKVIKCRDPHLAGGEK